MSDKDNIQMIAHAGILREKWDRCVGNSDNGLAYAQSFYLDTMAETWDALVMGDYQIVMPLPKRKKWGISYLFQPFLTPQLGIFGKSISEGIVTNFLNTIPASFKLWDISLNAANKVGPAFAEQFVRQNYILNLQPPYETINTTYASNIFRNISRAQKNNAVCKKDIDIDEIIAICKKEYPKFTKVESGVFEKVRKIYHHFRELGQAVSYGVYMPDGELSASCAFLFYRKRAYYWLVGNTIETRSAGASHLLIDQFILDHAGKELILDFEGSDQPTIAEFYQRFGAVPEPYTTIYRQRLPFPLNLMKRKPGFYKKLASEEHSKNPSPG
jgi:hypothetical protein